MLTRDTIHITGAPASWNLRRSLNALLRACRAGRLIPKRSRAVLSVTCAGSARMARLNRAHRRKTGLTDVLSFEQKAVPVRGVVFLGDLVLCVPVARARARRFGHGVRVEAAILLAHGLLHLLGYDHERSGREAARMASAELRLLRAAGIRQSAGLVGRAKVKRPSP